MPETIAVNILDDVREDLEATSEVIGHLDEIFLCIEDLARTDSTIARKRIARLASLGRFTAEGWRSTIVGMQSNLTMASRGVESHLVTAQAFAGTRAHEQSREDTHA
jgi:hypothetical protein